ncbi:hypothetical protein [Jiangella endophytica]|uniref:hypothetical protein n=1 Tax=Jiangella endophytica TaxID=1623398 RepID=UPI001300220B|nr:hypothetical protein [Jiangella endophytica]
MAMLAAGCGGGGRTPGGAAEPVCAAPLTQVAEPTVRPADVLRVTADHLVDACYDLGEGLVAEPLDDQAVIWRQGAAEIELAVVDAEPPSGRVEVAVSVPADAAPGAATITVGRGTAAEVTVTP